jgi:hypothetical protein
MSIQSIVEIARHREVFVTTGGIPSNVRVASL